MHRTYECKCHPDKEPIPAWTYLGLIEYVCPECKSPATKTKTIEYVMHYWQNGDTGRTCATLHVLSGDWYEITQEAYFEIERRNHVPTPKE